MRSPRQMLLSWFTEDLVESHPSLPNTALQNRSFPVFVGKTLGGTSSINGMQFGVPIKGTIEKWRIHGLTTQSSRKYFKRVIDQIEIAVPKGNLRHEYVRDYLSAAQSAGFAEARDILSSRNSRVVNENYLSADGQGFRLDSCTAYLSHVVKGTCKHNLHLIQDATVTKVLLSKSDPKRATGVEYIRSSDDQFSSRRRILAREEVILSAGPIGTPRLLQLSGIGPPRVLRKAGVTVQVALPVGQKCQARTVVPINVNYTGVLLEPSNNSTLVFSQEARDMFDRGNGGVLGIAASFATGKDKLRGYFSVNGNTFPDFVDRQALNAGCMNNVASFGYINIRDQDPRSAPELQLSLLKNKGDLRRLMMCVQDVVGTFKEFPRRFNLSIVDPINGEVTEQFIRATAIWNGHLTGGCRVGSVLRGDLTVRKTKGLRVVDSSSLNKMPLSAGPMGSVYMIAEYMAEVIAGKQNSSTFEAWQCLKFFKIVLMKMPAALTRIFSAR